MSLLSPLPIFSQRGKDNFVMEINNRYFNINEEAKMVIEILSHSSTYHDATIEYNKINKDNYTEEEFSYYTKELLKKFDLENKEKSFLLVEKIILPAKQTSQLASLFQWAFMPMFFWISFSILSLFSLIVLFGKDNHQDNSTLQVPILMFMLGYLFTVLLHEIGHIAACRRFTGKNGGIGVGIYIIYPVFFSDISAIWHSTKHQKTITNLAGIYMQFWCALLAFGIGFFSDNNLFIDFSKSLIILCFVQIFPFIRSDGYWLISDLCNTPNLLVKSKEKIKELVLNNKTYVKTFSITNFLVTLYGLLNIFIIVIFAYYQLFVDPQALLELPQYLYKIGQQIVTGDWLHIAFDSKYISVILFYYLCVIYIKKGFNEIRNRLGNKIPLSV